MQFKVHWTMSSDQKLKKYPFSGCMLSSLFCRWRFPKLFRFILHRNQNIRCLWQNLKPLIFFFRYLGSPKSWQCVSKFTYKTSVYLAMKWISFLSIIVLDHMLFHRSHRWILEEILTGLVSNRDVRVFVKSFSLGFNDNRISDQALSIRQHFVLSIDCNLNKCCNDGNRTRSSYVSDLKADGEILSFLFSPRTFVVKRLKVLDNLKMA